MNGLGTRRGRLNPVGRVALDRQKPRLSLGRLGGDWSAAGERGRKLVSRIDL